MSDYQVPISQGPQNFRKRLNAILARFEEQLPGVGSSLPSSAPEGRFFTVTGMSNTLYQRLNGNWEAV